ncbi:hypothetical protein ACED29_15175 [Shewanella sp. 5S214]
MAEACFISIRVFDDHLPEYRQRGRAAYSTSGGATTDTFFTPREY